MEHLSCVPIWYHNGSYPMKILRKVTCFEVCIGEVRLLVDIARSEKSPSSELAVSRIIRRDSTMIDLIVVLDSICLKIDLIEVNPYSARIFRSIVSFALVPVCGIRRDLAEPKPHILAAHLRLNMTLHATLKLPVVNITRARRLLRQMY